MSVEDPRVAVNGFRLELIPMPGWPAPPEIRVRQGLKFLRRRFGLRCTAISELPEEPEATFPRIARISETRTAAGPCVETSGCPVCGSAFEKRRPWARFCSKRCRFAWRDSQRRQQARDRTA